ncbi:rhamnogalacturonan lyase [Chitinophaga niabensis]|uniref:rhamnogalacturonan lyase n=1 Tax=Chitinophaga niabensis TaxID=536979 RepID=UPI0031B9C475
MKSTFILLYLFVSLSASAQRQMECLDRGVVAISMPNGSNFISWRSLVSDEERIAFSVYRDGEKINAKPITDVTSFEDMTADTAKAYNYEIRAEKERSKIFKKKAGGQPYISVPLQLPPGYHANDASVGDVDGDGEYEIILHVAGRGKDNSQAGITDPPVFQAYKLDGTLLWTIRLGRNIREGAHYTQFMVYDLDGDGKAEVAMKTADGTMDGVGKVIGDSSKDWRNERGYILAGPEFLTVFSGLTGAALATVNYIPSRHTSLQPMGSELKEVWGDGNGNRVDRFLACVAYLDGKQPSLIMSRGYYTRTVLSAWNFRNGQLTPLWTFDSDEPGGANRAYRGQGNHNLSVADVDADGKDEIIFGAMTIDDNGKGLYSTGLGHGDALHVTDLDPARPGLEVFDIQERFGDAGASFRDARTGEVIWKKASVKAGDDGEGPGRGLALDIDPRYPGYECWVAGAGIMGLFDAKGNKIAERTPACNMGIYWDGDVLSEILNGTSVEKWMYETSTTTKLLEASRYNCVRNNGTKSNPVLSADILGDWREEVIYRTTDSKELRIFSTTIPTNKKFYTLMQDPQYRLSIAWQNVAYNQPPHTGFHMGEGMKQPPKPNIQLCR